jgi:hypothetical protein
MCPAAAEAGAAYCTGTEEAVYVLEVTKDDRVDVKLKTVLSAGSRTAATHSTAV